MIDERLESFFQATPRRRKALWTLPSTLDCVIEWLAEHLDLDRELTKDQRSRFPTLESLLDPATMVVFCHAIHRRTLLPEETWRAAIERLLPGLVDALPPRRGEPDLAVLCRAIVSYDEEAFSDFVLEFARQGWNVGILLEREPNPIRLAERMKRTRFARRLRRLVDGWDPHSELDSQRLLQLAGEGDPCAQFQLGVACREAGRYEEGFRWFERSAALWAPESIRMVAFAFDYGQGVNRDLGRAAATYREAALIGDYRAALGLAIRYEKGDATDRDDEEAVYWLRIAAEHGVENAQLRLALHYASGDGVAVDPTEAARWLHEAAEAGEPEAQVELGLWYLEGKCVRETPKLFVAWNQEGAKGGSVRGLHNLGFAYEQGIGVEPDMNTALSHYRMAASRGCADCMTTLGDLYRDGLVSDGRADFDTAARWYRKAIDAGDADALFQLYYLHARTNWTNRDLEEAAKLLVRSAEAGDSTAQYLLGIAYGDPGDPDEPDRPSSSRFYIPGFECDDAKAVTWFARAAEQGFAEAMTSLGLCMKVGLGTEKDREGARQWFERAAACGAPSAQRELAIMIVESAKTYEEHAEAVRWFRLASDAGDVVAMGHLAFHYENGLGVERNLGIAAELERAAVEVEKLEALRRKKKRVERSGFKVVG